jgi:hypothetical protein
MRVSPEHGDLARTGECRQGCARAQPGRQQALPRSAGRRPRRCTAPPSAISLLQAQVEPHFLYNTLANLQLLIRSDPAAADEMTDDLIKYLRLSMRSSRHGLHPRA